MGDIKNINDVYAIAKGNGAKVGTFSEFKKFFESPGMQGYQNRKKVHGEFVKNGLYKGSYEDFAKDVGIAVRNQRAAQTPRQSSSNSLTGINNNLPNYGGDWKPGQGPIVPNKKQQKARIQSIFDNNPLKHSTITDRQNKSLTQQLTQARPQQQQSGGKRLIETVMPDTLPKKELKKRTDNTINRIYDTLGSYGAEMGTRDHFNKYMYGSYTNRKKVYDNLVKVGEFSGSYDDFMVALGMKKAPNHNAEQWKLEQFQNTFGYDPRNTHGDKGNGEIVKQWQEVNKQRQDEYEKSAQALASGRFDEATAHMLNASAVKGYEEGKTYKDIQAAKEQKELDDYFKKIGSKFGLSSALKKAYDDALAQYSRDNADNYNSKMLSANQYLGKSIMDLAYHNKAYDFKNLTNNIWSNIGNNLTQAVYKDMLAYNPNATKEDAAQQAKYLLGRYIYNDAVEKKKPTGNFDFFLKKLVYDNTGMSIIKGVARAASGGYVGQGEADREAMQKYGEAHPIANFVGDVGSFAVDFATNTPASLVGKAGGALVAKLGARSLVKKGVNKGIAKRIFMSTPMGRFSTRIGGGVGNMSAFETIKGASQQFETGQYDGVELLKSAGRGALMGGVSAIGGHLIGNVGNKAIKATHNGVGKAAINFGTYNVSKVTEGTIFAAPDILTKLYNEDGRYLLGEYGGFDTIGEQGDNRSYGQIISGSVAMMYGLGAMHGVKDAASVIGSAFKYRNPRNSYERRQNLMSVSERIANYYKNQNAIGLDNDDLRVLNQYGYGDFAKLFNKSKSTVSANTLEHNKERKAWVDEQLKQQKAKIVGKKTVSRIGKFGGFKQETIDVDKYGNEVTSKSRKDLEIEYDKARPEDVKKTVSNSTAINDAMVGYDKFTQMYHDTRVPQATREKLMYMLTGSMSAPKTIVSYRDYVNEDGTRTIETLSEDGDIVTSKTYDALDGKADNHVFDIERQIELNAIDLGEQSLENRHYVKQQELIKEAINQLYAGRKFEDVVNQYNNVLLGKDKSKDGKQLVKSIQNYIKQNEDLNSLTTDSVRAEIKSNTGIDVYDALKKNSFDRTEEDKNAIGEYCKKLLGDVLHDPDNPLYEYVNKVTGDYSYTARVDRSQNSEINDYDRRNTFIQNERAKNNIIESLGDIDLDNTSKDDLFNLANEKEREGYFELAKQLREFATTRDEINGFSTYVENRRKNVENNVANFCESIQNKNTGNIVMVSVHQGDKKVDGYLISGDIVFNDKGYVDKAKSSGMIVVKTIQTNEDGTQSVEVKSYAPSDIAGMRWETGFNEFYDIAKKQALDQFDKDYSDYTKIPFHLEKDNTYKFADADGNIHEAKVSNYNDKNVYVIIDGQNSITTMPRKTFEEVVNRADVIGDKPINEEPVAPKSQYGNNNSGVPNIWQPPKLDVGTKVEINGNRYTIDKIDNSSVNLIAEDGRVYPWTVDNLYNALEKKNAEIVSDRTKQANAQPNSEQQAVAPTEDGQGTISANTEAQAPVEPIKIGEVVTDKDGNVFTIKDVDGEKVVVTNADGTEDVYDKEWFNELLQQGDFSRFNESQQGSTEPQQVPNAQSESTEPSQQQDTTNDPTKVGTRFVDPSNGTVLTVKGRNGSGDVVLADEQGREYTQTLQDFAENLNNKRLVPEQEAAPVESEQPAAQGTQTGIAPQGDASEPMPTIEVGAGKKKTTTINWTATTPERGHQYLYNESQLPEEAATRFVDKQIENAQKNLDKLKKSGPKDALEIFEYQRNVAEHEKQLAEAQKLLDYWNAVKAEHERVKAEESKAEEVQPQQQGNVQAGVVSDEIRQKWNDADKEEGAQDEITLPNGETISGHYVIVESGVPTASHQSTNGFAETEGFPTDENGQTVNDRDYKRDQEAQQVTRQMANSYDQRAVQSPVVVSQDGVVLSGNGRTMAGEIAALQGTDTKYNDYLRTHAEKFGLTAEQVGKFKHPRLVFVADGETKYDANTFAKFNQREMKSQSKTEKAVKMGKLVDDHLFGRVMDTIDKYKSLSDFYADDNATHAVIKQLAESGIIQQTDMADLFDGGKLSEAGQALVESILIGKVFDGNPDAVRQITDVKSMRKSVMNALTTIVANNRLRGGYSLADDLAQAVDLVHKARQNGYKLGDRVSSFAGQGNLFAEDGATVADYKNASVMMLADVLNDNRMTQLKKVLQAYNERAKDPSEGTADIFTGEVTSKQDIINEINEQLGYGRKRKDSSTETTSDRQGSGSSSSEQGTPVGKSNQGSERSGKLDETNSKETEAERGKQADAPQEYVYQLTQRPYGIGSQPEGETRHVDDGSKFGAVVYDHPLSAEEAKNFSLTPITEAKALEGRTFEVPFGEDKDIYHIDKVDDDGTIHYHVNDEAPLQSRYHDFLSELGDEAKEANSDNTKHSLFENRTTESGEVEPLSDGQVSAITEISDYLGQKLSIVDSAVDKQGRHNNGLYNPNTRTMYLARDGQQPMGFVFGHEATHAVKEMSEGAYGDLHSAVRELMGDKKWNAEVAYKKELYKKNGIELTDEGAAEEVVADYVGSTLNQGENLKKLAYRLKHPVLSKIRESLTKLLDFFRGKKMTAEEKQVQGMLDTITKAMKKAKVEMLQTEHNLSKERATELAEHGMTMRGGVVMSDVAADVVDNAHYIPDADHNEFEQAVKRSLATMPLTIEYYKSQKNAQESVANALGALMTRFTVRDAVTETISPYISHSDVRANLKNRTLNSSPIRKQGDIYIVSFDMDTTCPRTFAYLTMVKEVERRIHRPLTQTECIQLTEKMRAYGLEIPCTYCYAENKRQALKEAMHTFLDARRRVMGAETEEEEISGMYGHNSVSNPNSLTNAAKKKLNAWRALKKGGNVYNPTMEMLYTHFSNARDKVLTCMDTLAQNKSIGKKSSPATIAKKVAAELGIELNTELRGQLKEIAEEWKFDVIEGHKHSDFTPVSGYNTKLLFNELRSLGLWREMVLYSKSSSQAKNVDRYVPYTDEFGKLTKAQIDAINAIDGFRMHSTNDFRIDYVLDYFQILAHMSQRDVKGQTYTKNPDFVRIFGKSGIRINMSIAAYGGENGSKVMMNQEEGFHWGEAQNLRKQYKNAGIMFMVTNDTQLQYALDHDWIDMIIPFHASGLPKRVWYDMRAWEDYTHKQSENGYSASEMKEQLAADGVEIPQFPKGTSDARKYIEILKVYNEHFGHPTILVKGKDGAKVYVPHFEPGETKVTDVNGKVWKIPGHENNRERYLELCKQYGIKPRFTGIKVRDNSAEGGGKEIDITEHPRYMNLIREISRIDTPQDYVKFEVDKVDENLPKINEEASQIIFGEVKSEKLGQHMTPMEYAMYQLYDFSKKGGYGNVQDYKELTKDYGDLAGEFIDDVVNSKEKRPLNYLNETDRMMFRIAHKSMYEAAGLDPNTAPIPYHPEPTSKNGKEVKHSIFDPRFEKGGKDELSHEERLGAEVMYDTLKKAIGDDSAIIDGEVGQRVLDDANKRGLDVREHKVFHGSAADFIHFDHSHMGEGEGAQAYGWGTYVTEVKGIAQTYATASANKNREYRELIDNIAKYGIRCDSLKNLIEGEKKRLKRQERQVERDKEYAERKDLEPSERTDAENIAKKQESRLRDIQEKIDSYQKELEEESKNLEEAKKKYAESNIKRHLYTVEIPDDDGGNYLDWVKKPTEGQVNAIANILARNPKEVAKYIWDNQERFYLTDRELIELYENPENFSQSELAEILKNDQYLFHDGQHAYNAVKNFLGSQEKASKALDDIGFVGIKYPADYRRGGREDGAQNFVIFNEKNAQITDHVRFFRTKDGVAYGFTVGGKVYIDPRVANSETPIHEYSHLWATAMQKGNPEEWDNIVKLMKGTSVWDEVKKTYPELENDSDIADEVLAHYSGRRGAERLREQMRAIADGKGSPLDKADAMNALHKVKAALDKFWKGVADFLGIHFTTAEEVADRVMKDLLDGVDPRKFGVDNKLREQFIGERGAKEADHAEEVTTRLDNLNVAREMEEGKKSAKEIKMATGWERGADGKWRYEIPDLKIKPNVAIEEHRELYEKEFGSPIGKLSDFVEGEDLFKAYPQLRNITLYLRDPKEKGSFWFAPANAIVLGRSRTTNKKIRTKEERKLLRDASDAYEREYEKLSDDEKDIVWEYSPGLSEKTLSQNAEFPKLKKDNPNVARVILSLAALNDLESSTGKTIRVLDDILSLGTIVHEVQHAIQDAEGFARGGNENMWRTDTPESVKEKYNEKVIAYRKLFSQYNSLSDTEKKSTDGRSLRDSILIAGNELDEINRKYRLGKDGYMKLSGEVEARNASNRVYADPEERRQSLASETEDVSREDQIFLFGDGESNSQESASEEYSLFHAKETKRLPVQEYAKLDRAIHTHNDFKNGRVNGEFTDNNYYLYTHHRDGSFDIEDGFPIVGNEDIIKQFQDGIKEGTIRNAKDIARFAKELQINRDGDNSSNADVERGSRRNGGFDSLDLSHEADGRRSDESMGERVSGLSPEEIYSGGRIENTEEEAAKIADSIFDYDIANSVYALRGQFRDYHSKELLDHIMYNVEHRQPKGWAENNKYAIEIIRKCIEARKRELDGKPARYPKRKDFIRRGKPLFRLQDGTFIKSGSYFSGGGLLEEGLKRYLDPSVAVEFNEKISGVYADNFGNHIVTADVRDVDPRELAKNIDGEVQYFHASPVCKNYSRAKRDGGEVELDKETAQSTADFISAKRPKVVTIENVKGYKDSEALKIITDELTRQGYDWDMDVYNAADYGGYTKRERLIIRAVRDGKLPEKPQPLPESERKHGWMEAVEDLIDDLPEKEGGVKPWMDERLKGEGIDYRKIDKPLYVFGQGNNAHSVPHAFADELIPTLRTHGGDVIIMPDGRVLQVTPRVLARLTGLGDDYVMPKTDKLAHTIIGNGIPTQLSENVIGPLLDNAFNGGERASSESMITDKRNAEKRDATTQLTSALHLDGEVEILETNEGLEGKEKRAKGWYDPKTGKITVVLGNHESVADVQRTIFHEAVAHKGLRAMVGEEKFGTFIDNIYKNADKDIQARIDELADTKYKGNKRVATEEYMASLAEDMNFEKPENKGLLAKVKKLIANLLKEAGIDLGFKLTDKDLRYMLWRSYKNLQENGGKRNIFDIAEDARMREKLEQTQGAEERAARAEEQQRMFRDGNENLKGVVDGMRELAQKMVTDQKKDKNETIGALTSSLKELNQAMSAQRAYDLSTVKSVTGLVKDMLDSKLIQGVTDYEQKRMLSVIENVHGKNDTRRYVTKLMDIAVGNMERNASSGLMQLLHTRGQKVDQRGVVVQKGLDPDGQKLAGFLKSHMGSDAETINNRMIEVQNRMSSNNEAIAESAAIEYQALQLADYYRQYVKDSKENDKQLRQELADTKEQWDAGEIQMTKADFIQYRDEINFALLQNKIGRAQALQDLINNIGGQYKDSAERAKAWQEQEKKRVGDIYHNANSDLEGVPCRDNPPENKWTRFTNGDNAFGIATFLFEPQITFANMLEFLGNKNATGRGYLYNRYMHQAGEATDNEIIGYRGAVEELDNKAKEMFGKDFTNLMRQANGEKPATLYWMEQGEQMSHQITVGNMLYIYMVNKMADGRMKLRKMGISDENVNAIVDKLNEMNPNYVQFADWMQNEFLPSRRNKYNEVHKRMFGTSMPEVEDYFPLKILKNAINQDNGVDATQPVDKPSTTTGAIKKRTRNSLPLDLLNADAFEILLGNVKEMEHWAAFAEFNRDINTLLNYKKFRSKLQNMTSLRFGSGKDLLNNFTNACKIATGTYGKSGDQITKSEKSAVNATKLVTAAKIAFRINTALKQLLSFPAYFSDANPLHIGQSLLRPDKAWKFAMTLPQFRERFKGRMAGDPMLATTEADWKAWRSRTVELAAKYGMSPNAFVDAVTVSIGAHAMYKTRYQKLIKQGYDPETADAKAREFATEMYNKTQQSSVSMYMSPLQSGISWYSRLLTLFRNASMEYSRQTFAAIQRLGQKGFGGKENYQTQIDFMTKQFERDGIDHEQAVKNAKSEFWGSIGNDAVRVAVFNSLLAGLWNLGSSQIYQLFGSNDDDKKKLIEDSFIQSLWGGIEGLTGGDIWSNIAMAGVKFAKGEADDLGDEDKNIPMVSDMINTYKYVGHDNMMALQSCADLIGQAVTGVAPTTVVNVLGSIWNLCFGDTDSAVETTMLWCKIMNAPKSSMDKIYLDEIGTTLKEGKNMSVEEIAERYAEYKRKNKAALVDWAYSDEDKAKVNAKYAKEATDNAREVISGEYATDDYKKLVDEAKQTGERQKQINDLKDKDPEEYRKQNREFVGTPEHRRYKIVERQKYLINKEIQKYLREPDPNKRAEIMKSIQERRDFMVTKANEVK